MVRAMTTAKLPIFLVLALALGSGSCACKSGGGAQTAPPAPPAADSPQAELTALYASYEPRLESAYQANQDASWQAYNFGKPEQFAEAARTQLAMSELNSDPKTFATLDRLRKSGQITDPLQQRVLEVLYLTFTESQIPADLRKKLIDESTALEESFNTFRAEVDGKKVTANQISEVLQKSNDSAERQRYWDASKAVGPQLVDRVVALVEQRNQAARALGYPDFYQMQLRLSEQDPAQIAALFEQIDQATAEPFRRAKADLDQKLAARFGITPDQLRPWHYGDVFFQEAPQVEGLDLDASFAKLDPVKICSRYYHDIGLPAVDEILVRSDLDSRPGKVEHAFSFDLDRSGDIRVLANMQPNEYWTSVLLHELGHSVYDAYIDRSLPFVLRVAAHSLTTEGVAEMFGALTRDPDWLVRYTGMPADQAARVGALAHQRARLGGLVFARWSLVVVNFERAMYADPRQDLEKLWWQLVSRYQGLTPPDSLDGRADWAAKIHIVTYPAYYHNYLLGQLFAAQLRQRIGQLAGSDAAASGQVSIMEQPRIGKFLIDEVFAPGDRYRWDELVKRATGRPLSPEAFLAELAE